MYNQLDHLSHKVHTRVMEKDHIPIITVSDDLPVGVQDIVFRRCHMDPIVHEQMNILIAKALDVPEILLHIQHIVVTATQYALVVADVIDPNHHGPTGPRRLRGNELKI